MKEPHGSRILRFIYRHERLANAYDWLGDNWLMAVIYLLFAAVVLCMVNLTVMVLTTWNF